MTDEGVPIVTEPEPVIVVNDIPLPAATDVTVPPGLDELIVITPAAFVRVTFVPALISIAFVALPLKV